MKHLEKICSVLSLSALALVSAQSLRASPPIGAVVQNSHYDAQKGIATFDIVNTSHKDISAFSLQVRVIHPDGTESMWEYGNDFLPFMINVIEVGHPIPPYQGMETGALPPGAVFAIDVPVGQQPIQSASATVEVVVYADDTAEAANAQALKSIESERKGRILGMQKANGLMRRALADLSDIHPSITVVAQLKVLAKQYETLPPAGAESEGVGLLDAATDISNAPRLPSGRSDKEDAFLRSLLKTLESRISLYSPHTALTKTVRP